MLLRITSILFETSDLIGQVFYQFTNSQSENDFHIHLIFINKQQKRSNFSLDYPVIWSVCTSQEDWAAKSKASQVSVEITWTRHPAARPRCGLDSGRRLGKNGRLYTTKNITL